MSCDFTLIAGLRYNAEWKKFETNVIETLGPLSFQSLQGEDDDLWTGTGAELSLAWNFLEASDLYAKFSRGWKGGHFNGGATSIRAVVTGVEPEVVVSYEGGLRSYWFEERMMLNVTGFYYDYQDLQVFIIEQTDLGYPIPKLVNANDALVYGVELDLGASPLPGLNFTYNFAWVESEYLDFKVSFTEKRQLPRPCPRCPKPPPQVFLREFDYTGNPLIASPRFSMTGSVDYRVPLPGTLLGRGFGSLTPRFSFVWKDAMFFDACRGQGTRCNFKEEDWGITFGQDPFWVLNAQLTWRSESERLQITGWVRNFLDEHYKTQNFDLTRGIGIILDAYADPRTFGITATLTF
jgi:iron complex outermembrane receptor protein